MKKTIIVLIALTIFGVSAMSRERKPLRRKENLLLAISYGFHVPPVDDILAEDFKTIKEYGYTHVDIDIFWSETEWREGILNLDGIQKMFDLANEAGLKVIANFIGTPERSAPHWAFRKFSDEGIVNGPSGQARGPEHAFGTFNVTTGSSAMCYDGPRTRQAIDRFVSRVVEAFKDHEALTEWDIWSEPGKNACQCPHTIAAFREWLVEKYHTLQGLNRAWGMPYVDWNEVVPPASPGSWHPIWIDWMSFMTDRMAEHMTRRAQIVRDLDPHHPVSAHVAREYINRNIDNWTLQAPLDEFGTSYYQTIGEGRRRSQPASWMYSYDRIRSACLKSKQGRWFISEQQIAQIEDVEYVPKSLLWLNHVASLACANTGFVEWTYRLPNPTIHSVSFGLVGVDRKPNPWAKDLKKFNALAKKLSPYWEQPAIHSRVAILYDPKSYFYGSAHRSLDTISDSMEGFFALALDLNVSIDFLHDKFLTLEELSGYKTLLVPTKPIIGERTAGLLRDYVKQGGTIVAESRFGRFKGNGYVCGDPPHGLQDVFGCKTVAIFREDNVKIGLKDGALKGRYEWEYYEPTTGEVLGRHEKNGGPAVIRSTYGKGSTLLIGTNIGQEYSITRNEAMRKFLSPYLTSEMSVENIVSPTTFSVRLVHCKEKDVLFLMNFGDDHEKPTVRMEQAYARIQDIETDEILGTAVKDISIKVPPKTAKILLLDR